MTAGAAGDPLEAPVDSVGLRKSPVDRNDASMPASSNGSRTAEARWEVRILPELRQITRVAFYGPRSQSETDEREKVDDVIWPTWPATIEEETEVATTPLADLQRYWSTAGNRLRESAKWMATVLGAAMAAVIGTSPFAHLSGYHLHVAGAVIGSVGLLCLAITMVLVLRVMQPPEISFVQIEDSNEKKIAQSPRRLGQRFSSLIRRHEKNALCGWKSKVEMHPDLYLPCGVEDLKQLRSSIRLEEATLVQLTRCWVDTSDTCIAKNLRRAQEARAARLLELRTAAARITAIGEYYALQVRSTQARYYGTTFGFLATALIVLAFAWPLK
jgi:hypothetical protein